MWAGGLNYDRRGIAYQLQLDVQPYSTDQLDTLLQQVVIKINSTDSLAHLQRGSLDHHSVLFAGAVRSYGALSANNRNLLISRLPSSPLCMVIWGITWVLAAIITLLPGRRR